MVILSLFYIHVTLLDSTLKDENERRHTQFYMYVRMDVTRDEWSKVRRNLPVISTENRKCRTGFVFR